MATVDEIKKAIEVLPEEEFIKLRKWIAEKDWQKRDTEITKDSNAGKLDFLMKEATDMLSLSLSS